MMRKKINDEVLNRFVIDGRLYIQKNEDIPSRLKGSNGDLHLIRVKDSGRIIQTTNLWGGGSITGTNVGIIPAEFIDEEGNVIHKRSSYDEERL